MAKYKGGEMNRNDKKSLKVLNCGNALGLSIAQKKLNLKKTGHPGQPSGSFFDNLITVEELAVIFGLAPQTIRNWVAQGQTSPMSNLANGIWFLTWSSAKVVKPKGRNHNGNHKKKIQIQKTSKTSYLLSG